MKILAIILSLLTLSIIGTGTRSGPTESETGVRIRGQGHIGIKGINLLTYFKTSTNISRLFGTLFTGAEYLNRMVGNGKSIRLSNFLNPIFK